MTTFETVKQKLIAEKEVTNLGPLRTFKFVLSHLNSKNETILFLIDVLNFKKWEANKTAYFVEYEKKRYALKKTTLLRQ